MGSNHAFVLHECKVHASLVIRPRHAIVYIYCINDPSSPSFPTLPSILPSPLESTPDEWHSWHLSADVWQPRCLQYSRKPPGELSSTPVISTGPCQVTHSDLCTSMYTYHHRVAFRKIAKSGFHLGANSSPPA